MSTDQPITAADRLRELNLPLNSKINYKLDSMFPVLTGWFVNSAIKKKYKLVKESESTLEQVLRPGEEVLYVGKGVQYSFWEQYFLGVWANLINQTVFVLTNARLLLFHTNTKGKPKDMYWMIYYSQIVHLKKSWFGGAVVVKLKDGKTFKFGGFTGQDKKQMPLVFKPASASYQERGFDPPVSQSRENLCLYCFKIVPKGEVICHSCGAEYWKPRDVALRSLIFPSWGDFVMRHYIIAVMELIGYAVWWFIVGTLIVHSFSRGDPDALVVSLTALGVLFAFAHIPDAVLTYYIANKGLNRRRPPDPARIPADNEPEV